MRGRREYGIKGGQDHEGKNLQKQFMKFVGTHELYIYDLCMWETDVGFPSVCCEYHCLIKKIVLGRYKAQYR